ncbi:MAG: metalloregulator ArsR/SmtB family transcription factor [Pseudomonadales bacterium]|uniref:Arsenate reductase n=1 Tax=Oleiphilus messinensis TaxID=141451 RepID=A0A1Y0IDM2_9GAMM|nr:metalloregulator ArsR/SmtB family transcription factor [Oleiphilus messinensis]ARU58628.1 arsenate reductase [Oleiphilus messinensis]MCG8614418.1 metalloregulator ArsR/SmtB family transcription factor [Pseudomonadales bacterium]
MSPLQFYKCLADETRLRCLLLIQSEGELCVCELMAALDEVQPKVSRHLAQLRKCELLQDRRQGQWVFYRINPALPEWAKSVLDISAVENSSWLLDNITRLGSMGDRPERVSRCC